ncbi:hypothetical protein [Azospirillum himalayense]|uniref:Uncharacterized protein n=1 Tax=Azospirillum himalayense TaxID=654847 RepID=A0ABW0FZ96_9PROT
MYENDITETTEAVTVAAQKFEDIGDLADLSYSETLEYRVRHPVSGAETTWVWKLAGPAHPVTLELDEATAKRNRDEESKRQAENIARIKANKPPLPDNRTIADLRERNVAYVATRVLGFSPVKLDGALIEFSPDMAKKLLADPAKEWLFNQIVGAVNAKEGFIKSFAAIS